MQMSDAARNATASAATYQLTDTLDLTLPSRAASHIAGAMFTTLLTSAHFRRNVNGIIVYSETATDQRY